MALIVIADTYPALRIGLREFLEKILEQVTIIDVMDNNDLSTVLKGSYVDLVILDADKSGESTMELWHYLNREWPNTRVLIYGERKTGIAKTSFFKMGATIYIQKESTIDDHIYIVKQCLLK